MASNRNPVPPLPMCSAQVACDGRLVQTRKEICGACERTIRQRERAKTRGLRGEHFYLYDDSRYRRG